MSGETQREESGWTVDTSREDILRMIADLTKYFEQRFTDQDKAVQAALLAAKEAVLKAEVASEKRFESVNEFRGQLADQTATLMPRQEYTVQHRALEQKLSELTDRINKTEGGRTSSEATVRKIYGAIATVGAILAIIVLIANGFGQ